MDRVDMSYSEVQEFIKSIPQPMRGVIAIAARDWLRMNELQRLLDREPELDAIVLQGPDIRKYIDWAVSAEVPTS